MAALIGMLVGGVLITFLLYALWEFVLFKRICNDPVTGKMLSVIAAWFTASAIGGFGLANDGPYRWDAFGIYAIPAILVGVYAYSRGVKVRESLTDDLADIADTFR